MAKFVDNILNLEPGMSEKTKAALNGLPIFLDVNDGDLIVEASAKLRGRKITDRFTAMLVIVGTRPLNHPDFQVKAQAVGA